MKTHVYQSLMIIPLVALALAMSACHDHSTGPNVEYRGSGQVTSELRSLGPIRGIVLESVGKVHLKQETAQSVEVSADDNIIDRVTTRVDNGTLFVGLMSGSYSNITIDVTVSLPVLQSIRIAGAGSVDCATPFNLDSLSVVIAGAGSATISGTVTRETILVAGTGSVYAGEMHSSICSVTISGTGNAEVAVADQLDAVITGVGSITYSGNPPVVHQLVSGIGSLIRRP